MVLKLFLLCLDLSNKVHLLTVNAAGCELLISEAPNSDRRADTLSNTATLTSVMAFRAVSEPMLRSEPGILLETVAGTITMGTQSSSYFPRAAESSSNPT